MSALRRLSIIDQTMEHIRTGVASGRWSGRLPGVRPLSGELGVSRETLRTALHRLEEEGFLSEGGASRPRNILNTAPRAKSGSLRIAIILMQRMASIDMRNRSFLLRLMHDLEAAGHATTLVNAPATPADPGPAGLTRIVGEKDADAWVVYMGSKETLRWFSEQPFPTLAIGGRCTGLPIAATGINYAQAIRDATRELIRLGHRRIVYVCPRHARLPEPSGLIVAFLEELRAAGIPAGAYNTPDWEETPVGFHKLLASLFQFTPPTALILWDALQVAGATAFFSERKLRIPKDVSVLAHSSDESVTWQNPEMGVADFSWEDTKMLRHIVRWADDAGMGKPDKTQEIFASKFTPSSTLGPAPTKVK